MEGTQCTLPGYGRITAYRQGELGGMCGIYSAINAARLISPELVTRRALWTGLYRFGVEWLSKQDRLKRGVLHGMSCDIWKELQHALYDELSSKVGISYRMRPLLRRRGSLGEDPAQHIREALGAGRAVLCLLDGALDHFTVIAGFTHNKWLLHDSYGYRWIAMRNMAFEEERKPRHYVPLSSLILLYRSEVRT